MHPKSPNFVLGFGVLFVWRIKLALYTKIRKIFLDFGLLTLSICIDKWRLILYNKLTIIENCVNLKILGHNLFLKTIFM